MKDKASILGSRPINHCQQQRWAVPIEYLNDFISEIRYIYIYIYIYVIKKILKIFIKKKKIFKLDIYFLILIFKEPNVLNKEN